MVGSTFVQCQLTKTKKQVGKKRKKKKKKAEGDLWGNIELITDLSSWHGVGSFQARAAHSCVSCR